MYSVFNVYYVHHHGLMCQYRVKAEKLLVLQAYEHKVLNKF